MYLAEGVEVDEVIRRLGVTNVTYYRWRKEYGGMRTDLMVARGVPDHVRSDNGSEFTAKVVVNGLEGFV